MKSTYSGGFSCGAGSDLVGGSTDDELLQFEGEVRDGEVWCHGERLHKEILFFLRVCNVSRERRNIQTISRRTRAGSESRMAFLKELIQSSAASRSSVSFFQRKVNVLRHSSQTKDINQETKSKIPRAAEGLDADGDVFLLRLGADELRLAQ